MGNISISGDEDFIKALKERAHDRRMSPSVHVRNLVRDDIDNSKSPEAIRLDIADHEAAIAALRERLNAFESAEATKIVRENVNMNIPDYDRAVSSAARSCVNGAIRNRCTDGSIVISDSELEGIADNVLNELNELNENPDIDREKLIEDLKARINKSGIVDKV